MLVKEFNPAFKINKFYKNNMAVILDPRVSGSLKPKIQTATNSQISRVSRLHDDLFHLYIESDAQARAKNLGLPYIDLYGFPIDTNHLTMMKKADVQRTKMGIFALKNKELYFATSDPGFHGQADTIKNFKTQGFICKLYLCSELGIKKILRTYNFVISKRKTFDGIFLDLDRIQSASEDGEYSLQNLPNLLAHISTTEIIETVLIGALQNKASDIHFEPENNDYVLRLRLDGVLHTFANLPKTYQKVIENRLKILAGVKLNVDNVPQDGRFSFKLNDKDIDVRVSMLPSSYGYSIVMRLLGTGTVELAMDALGFTGLARTRIENAIKKPQGLILTTGPTGSGKTTTLYTFLTTLNTGEEKIITLEDPVEYKIKGVSQTQIDNRAGYTFAAGIRSILRQDPDIILVGEIRDRETADTAVQASLTGHLVLSTVHTNDAAGAIPRLMEMGIKGFLLADSVEVIIGQRLVRKTCQYCKEDYTPTPEEQKIVDAELAHLPPGMFEKIPKPLRFYKAKGCVKCGGLGYKGRIGCYEAMTMTDGIRNLISTAYPSIVSIRNTAIREGMVTMFQDGILKSLEGITDLPEVFRNISYVFNGIEDDGSSSAQNQPLPENKSPSGPPPTLSPAEVQPAQRQIFDESESSKGVYSDYVRTIPQVQNTDPSKFDVDPDYRGEMVY
jgi:type II secretory ATPase GspE/PulE/Tfp pilus assembly ATPase PilB-like protein